jgi:hypothetical protein
MTSHNKASLQVQALTRSAVLAAALGLGGCGTFAGNPGSKPQQPNPGSPSSVTPTGSVIADAPAGACPTTPVPAPANGGQLVFHVAGDVDPCSVAGYIVGKQDVFKLVAAQDGSFFIDQVPAGKYDVILVGRSAAPTSLLDDTADRGVRLAGVEAYSGKSVDQGLIDLPIAGSLTGSITLSGASDFAGIDVYIPGTSYSAKTDSKGSFTLAGAPVGTEDLYVDKSGYYRGQVEGLTVATGKATAVPAVTLVLSTGVDGMIQLAGGGASYSSRTVPVVVGATTDAVLMKLSEDKSFVDAPWVPIVSSTTFTFAGDGQRTLYVEFADDNGLASSPFSATIVIDTTAPAVTGVASTENGSVMIPTNGAFQISVTANDGDGTGVTAYKVYAKGAGQPGEAAAPWQTWTAGDDVMAASIQAPDPGSGYTEICAEAKDRFDHVSAEACEALSLLVPVYVPDFASAAGWHSSSLWSDVPYYVAQSFTAGASFPATAIGIGAIVLQGDTVTINADGGGQPGAVLGQYLPGASEDLVGGGFLPGNGQDAGFLDTLFASGNPVQIASGVRYWIVWNHAVSPNCSPRCMRYDGGSNALPGEQLLKSDDGATWSAWSGSAPADPNDMVTSLRFLFF